MASTFAPYVASAGVTLVAMLVTLLAMGREPEPLPTLNYAEVVVDSRRRAATYGTPAGSKGWNEGASEHGPLVYDFRSARHKTVLRYLWDNTDNKGYRSLFSLVPREPLVAFVGSPDEWRFWALACPRIDGHTASKLDNQSAVRLVRDPDDPDVTLVLAKHWSGQGESIIAFRYTGEREYDRQVANDYAEEWMDSDVVVDLLDRLKSTERSYVRDIQRQTNDLEASRDTSGSITAFEIFRELREKDAKPDEGKAIVKIETYKDELRRKFDGRDYKYLWSGVSEMFTSSKYLRSQAEITVVGVAKLSDVADAVRRSGTFELDDGDCDAPTICTIAVQPRQYKLAGSSDRCLCVIIVPEGTPVGACQSTAGQRKVPEVVLKPRIKLTPFALVVQRVPGLDRDTRDDPVPVVWCQV